MKKFKPLEIVRDLFLAAFGLCGIYGFFAGAHAVAGVVWYLTTGLMWLEGAALIIAAAAFFLIGIITVAVEVARGKL